MRPWFNNKITTLNFHFIIQLFLVNVTFSINFVLVINNDYILDVIITPLVASDSAITLHALVAYKVLLCKPLNCVSKQ